MVKFKRFKAKLNWGSKSTKAAPTPIVGLGYRFNNAEFGEPSTVLSNGNITKTEPAEYFDEVRPPSSPSFPGDSKVRRSESRKQVNKNKEKIKEMLAKSVIIEEPVLRNYEDDGVQSTLTHMTTDHEIPVEIKPKKKTKDVSPQSTTIHKTTDHEIPDKIKPKKKTKDDSPQSTVIHMTTDHEMFDKIKPKKKTKDDSPQSTVIHMTTDHEMFNKIKPKKKAKDDSPQSTLIHMTTDHEVPVEIRSKKKAKLVEEEPEENFKIQVVSRRSPSIASDSTYEEPDVQTPMNPYFATRNTYSTQAANIFFGGSDLEPTAPFRNIAFRDDDYDDVSVGSQTSA